MMEKSRMIKIVEKWQKILRLRDWDIHVELVKKNWDKTGHVKVDLDDKRAVLQINDKNPKKKNIEAVIIHELLHIKLWGMDSMIEKTLNELFPKGDKDAGYKIAYDEFMHVLEETTEDLAKGFVEIGADDKSISFGRVK